MPTHTVLITDYAWPTLEREQTILAPLGIELLVAQRGDEAELVALAPQADAILTCWQKVTPAVLDAATKCVHVSRYGVGLDNIAVDYATKLGMVVTNVPQNKEAQSCNLKIPVQFLILQFPSFSSTAHTDQLIPQPFHFFCI